MNTPLHRFIVIFGLLAAQALAGAPSDLQRLEAAFDHPPSEAKPRAYWNWAHGNFDYSTITRELEEVHDKGLAGVDIFDLGVTDPLDVIPSGPAFMSDEQVDGMAFALEEAERLGLKLGLIVSSSWNAGGSWIEPEHGVMTLITRSEFFDLAEGREVNMAFPEVPESFEKPYGTFKLDVPRDDAGFPLFRREVAFVAYPVEAENGILDPASAMQWEGQVGPDGSLRFELPSGRWSVFRYVQSSFGQSLFIPSDNSKGLIADHFSAEATERHFGYIIDRLEQRLGDLSETALERLYLASFEAVALIKWTAGYKDAFLKLHGYDPAPWLPVLGGRVVGNEDLSARFKHDYLATVSELFINNHYRKAREISNRHGLLIASEAGGPGPPLHDVPTEDLKALGSLDVMRGEFWNRDSSERRDAHQDSLGLDILQVVKNIASAAHIYGHRVVEMEAFTSHHGHWEEGPMTLKPLADRAFCEGMTRVIYHTMTHNPPEAGTPGWSYQAGTHMGPEVAWWDLSKPFHEYLARCSALLQEGLFVADAAYYYGGKIPNFAHPKHSRPGLGRGYDYDDLNSEVLLQTETKVDAQGRLVLGSGMRYAVLVLPEDDRMDLAVLQKIETLVRTGATVIGPKPSRIYGLAGYPEDEQALQALADRVWGAVDGKRKTSGVYGAGSIHWGVTPRDVLTEKGIVPDLETVPADRAGRMDWIHRQSGGTDLYFVRNTKPDPVRLEALFRAGGRMPEWWNPVDGMRRMLLPFRSEGARTRVILELAGNEAGFVVFPEDARITRQSDWTAGPAESKPVASIDLSAGWTASFPAGWGAPPRVAFPELISWTESGDAGVRDFSGTAVYRKNFNLPEQGDEAGAFRHLLDLGEVREVCRVYLNGHDLGIGWFPPHVWDVSAYLRPGANHLVIEVAGTWLNRMIGDAKNPGERPYTFSNVANRGATNPSERPWADRPPAPSGLLGPVKLVSTER